MMSAVLDKPEAGPATIAEEVVETPPTKTPDRPRLESWKMPPISREVAQRLRDILGLREDEDLPEPVCILLGMRSAIDATYSSGEIPHSTLVDIVLQSQLLPLLVDPPRKRPGTRVVIRSQNREAIYVCAGPLGRDLVNRFGQWFLVDPDDIEAVPIIRQ